MIVAAHGNVDAYCEQHGLVIGERYEGKIEDYDGNRVVLVTDNCKDVNEFYYLKHKLRRRNVELISTHWLCEPIRGFIEYMGAREMRERRTVYRGRAMFGVHRVNGKEVLDERARAVVKRICELRDKGLTLREISADPAVGYLDGRRMSISTIQVILKNRGKYAELFGE